MTTPDRHLGDRISAYLDGELAPGEARAAETHVAACETCRAELAATSSVRAALRGLPDVPAPLGFLERLAARRVAPAWRRGVAAVASGAAAAVLLLVLATPSADRVGPPVGSLVERHAAGASLGGDPITEFLPIGVSVPPAP